MDFLSRSPFAVASILWQPRADRWMFTVVCKATFVLRPDLCPLAPQQDPPHPADVYGGNDERFSLLSAGELVPFKRHPEVLLVGSRCPPHSIPGSSTPPPTIKRSLTCAARSRLSWKTFIRTPLCCRRASSAPCHVRLSIGPERTRHRSRCAATRLSSTRIAGSSRSSGAATCRSITRSAGQVIIAQEGRRFGPERPITPPHQTAPATEHWSEQSAEGTLDLGAVMRRVVTKNPLPFVDPPAPAPAVSYSPPPAASVSFDAPASFGAPISSDAQLSFDEQGEQTIAPWLETKNVLPFDVPAPREPVPDAASHAVPQTDLLPPPMTAPTRMRRAREHKARRPVRQTRRSAIHAGR